jgi:hypothetical protein
MIVLASITIARCRSHDASPPPHSRHASNGLAMRALVHDGAGATTPGTLVEALRAPHAVVALPPQGDSGRLEPSQLRTPELEAEWQRALLVWKQEAKRIFDTCGPRDSKEREPALLTIAFSPMPREPEDPKQVMLPSWVSIDPAALSWLDSDDDAASLELCLAQLRGMPITVPLKGGEQRRAMSPSFEHTQLPI